MKYVILPVFAELILQTLYSTFLCSCLALLCLLVEGVYLSTPHFTIIYVCSQAMRVCAQAICSLTCRRYGYRFLQPGWFSLSVRLSLLLDIFCLAVYCANPCYRLNSALLSYTWLSAHVQGFGINGCIL